MARLRHAPSEAQPPPERGVKAATFRLLLDTAMALIREGGHVPSMAEVAQHCAVSRATAYRYFPTRSALIAAVMDASLGPVREFSSPAATGPQRLRDVFEKTFPRFQEFEAQMRAAVQLSLEQWAQHRAGTLQETPYRRGHRVRILGNAIAPLSRELSPAAHRRLHQALTVVYGIETYMVLKDIWGLSNRGVERVALWMADALVTAAVAQAHDERAARAVPQTASTASPPPKDKDKAMNPTPSPEWYERQYNNRANIPEAPQVLSDWARWSTQARACTPGTLDVPYGSGEGETLDIFGPADPSGPLRPVLVHIHGGYWRALSKADQSFIAPPFVQAGAVVVVPDYALAPRVSVEHISVQMVRALAWIWRHIHNFGGDPRRIVVAGHSAGGHLTGMVLACRWRDLQPDLPEDLVSRGLSLSGLFDMEPLRHVPFLAPDLGLTPASALRLSPAFMPTPKGRQLVALVGERESEEFHRQNRLIRERWGGGVVPVCETVPGCNHMTVLRELAEPDRRTHQLALELLGLRGP